MKRFAIFLASLILILAISPGISTFSLIANTESSCCSETCKPISEQKCPENQSNEKDCEGKSCNPFQVCGCCILACPNLPINNLETPAAFIVKAFTYQSVFSNPLIIDFWQPPRTV